MSQILAAPPAAVEAGDDPRIRVFSPAKQSRGIFVVLPGRGDVASHYVRLGERLSFDGYTVVVADAPVADVDVAVRVWNAAVADAARYPVSVLVGVDIAAGFAASAVANAVLDPTALVLAGAVTSDAPPAIAPTDPAAEIQLRTSCPVHREVLAASPAGGFFDGAAVTSWPAPGVPVTIPALILHGESDSLAPVGAVVEQTAQWGNRTVVTVLGGVHDVLNDIHHRTVAAELISFAERLRVDPTAPPVLTRETPVIR
jgi:alpha-beta hydrolase superfamily lysophospholipase